MDGQACVLYGAAQFGKDVDFVILSGARNYVRLHAALDELHAKRIAVPRFHPAVLARGRAVHFRCQVTEADGLRVDVMTRLRDLAPFHELWQRRTTLELSAGVTCELLAVEDLVRAKKTQRGKDWPVIDALRPAVDAEIRAEQEIDRRYWEPLKREMEEFRRAEREE